MQGVVPPWDSGDTEWTCAVELPQWRDIMCNMVNMFQIKSQINKENNTNR